MARGGSPVISERPHTSSALQVSGRGTPNTWAHLKTNCMGGLGNWAHGFFWGGSPATGLRWPHLAHANAWRICWLSLPGGVAGQATPPTPPPLSTSWRAPGSCATRPSPARSLKGSPANPHRWFTTPPGPPPPEKNGLGPILGPSGVIFSGFQPGIPSVSWGLGGG